MKKGDRVKISDKGIEHVIDPQHPGRLGTIVRLCRDPRYVVVKWDGAKSPYQYSVDFIEVVSQ
jgi:hypothetical protein